MRFYSCATHHIQLGGNPSDLCSGEGVGLHCWPFDLGVTEEVQRWPLEAEAAPLVLAPSFLWPFARRADAPCPPPCRRQALCWEEVPASCVEVVWTGASPPWALSQLVPARCGQLLGPVSPVCLLSVGGSF